jgi:hypothetical protein
MTMKKLYTGQPNLGCSINGISVVGGVHYVLADASLAEIRRRLSDKKIVALSCEFPDTANHARYAELVKEKGSAMVGAEAYLRELGLGKEADVFISEVTKKKAEEDMKLEVEERAKKKAEAQAALDADRAAKAQQKIYDEARAELEAQQRALEEAEAKEAALQKAKDDLASEAEAKKQAEAANSK